MPSCQVAQFPISGFLQLLGRESLDEHLLFPGYTSGHSTVSGAAAKILELFTGSDKFGDVEKRTAGILTEPGFQCSIIMRDGKMPRCHEKMTCDVALALPTFSATAEMAAVSRRPSRRGHAGIRRLGHAGHASLFSSRCPLKPPGCDIL
jgi:hypothetical protein